jgi:hypothetical protein
MSARKTKIHTFVITVTTDKACTEAHARREARDVIHGLYYLTQRDCDIDPGTMRIRSIKRHKAND